MVAVMDDNWKNALEIAHEYTAQSKVVMQWNYDKNAVFVQFDVGQLVMLQNEVKQGKFYNRFDGPYTVLERISDLTYRIQHNVTKKILKVHVNRLRTWKVQSSEIYQPLPPTPDHQEMVLDNDRQIDNLRSTRSTSKPVKVPQLAIAPKPKRRGRPPKKAAKQPSQQSPPNSEEEKKPIPSSAPSLQKQKRVNKFPLREPRTTRYNLRSRH
jgi:hypothetical protein